MMETKSAFRFEPVQGPIVPYLRGDPSISLVCDAARDGLIVGRMDLHRPALFVSAVSYLGLRRAARLAERVGDGAAAERWRQRASALRAAWRRGFASAERENDRTAISTIWPTFVGDDERRDVEAWLAARWQAQRTPDGGYKSPREWSYFDVAEAHQWTLLGVPEKSWATLEYYFRNQTSPGLYTWSEGRGEENTFGLWPAVRGWLAPKHVTPHYWTAAEMLLLQLDMLAFVEESESDPTWVIGAGVPKAWLDRPLVVTGVGTSRGVVDWTWKDGVLYTTIHGPHGRVRAGTAFGPEVQLHAEFVTAPVERTVDARE